MSFIITREIFDHGPRDRAQFNVLLTLADHCDESRTCWPGQKRIAERARMCLRTARDALAALERDGWITRTERITRLGRQHVYTLAEITEAGPVRPAVHVAVDRSEGVRQVLPDGCGKSCRTGAAKTAANPINEQIKEEKGCASATNLDENLGGRRRGKVTAFPKSGHIRYASGPWLAIARSEGVIIDYGMLADGFRQMCRRKGIALDAAIIVKTWRGYCRSRASAKAA